MQELSTPMIGLEGIHLVSGELGGSCEECIMSAAAPREEVDDDKGRCERTWEEKSRRPRRLTGRLSGSLSPSQL